MRSKHYIIYISIRNNGKNEIQIEKWKSKKNNLSRGKQVNRHACRQAGMVIEFLSTHFFFNLWLLCMVTVSYISSQLKHECIVERHVFDLFVNAPILYIERICNRLLLNRTRNSLHLQSKYNTKYTSGFNCVHCSWCW